MINLRYHIVSITAVFLALGIGLTLGSTFLDRVTVDTLKNQLETVQARVDETEAANDALSDRVGAMEARDEELAAELPERLVDGHLADVPVLVVATEGTDDGLVDQVMSTLEGAGAEVLGTWWLTARWRLDDPEERRDLSGVLDLASDDGDRLLRNGAIRVADVLLEAIAEDAPTEPVEGPPDAGELGTAVGEAQQPPAEPGLAAALEAIGFLDYSSAPGSGGDRVLLPSAGLRVVAVSGVAPDGGPHQAGLTLMEELTGDAAVPLVAAQGLVDIEDEDGAPASESDRRTTFVGPLRDGELTAGRLSTVDSLDTAAGLAALVLALEDAGDLRLGHFGVAPGASRLLPGTDPDT